MKIKFIIFLMFFAGISTAEFSISWKNCYNGLTYHECFVDIQNLEPIAKDFNLELLFSDTNYAIDKTTAKIYEWKILPTETPVYAQREILVNNTCYDNITQKYYDCSYSYNETYQVGTEIKNIAQWKETKANLFKDVDNKLKYDYGSINIPKVGSKPKYDDYGNTETENGIKKFKIAWETPIVKLSNGWGSSGLIAIVDKNTGMIYHPWWNVSYSYRRKINCLNMPDGLPLVIGGSNGFDLGCGKNLVWTYCSGETYLYYNNCFDYVVANDTNQLPFEVALGNGTSFNPTDVWASGFKGVWHLGVNKSIDSSGNNNNLVLVGQPTYKTDNGILGGRIELDGNDAYYVPASSSINWLGSGNFTFMFWIQQMATYSECSNSICQYLRKASGTPYVSSENPNGDYMVLVKNPSSVFCYYYTSAFRSPSWQLITITHDYSTCANSKIYYNDVSQNVVIGYNNNNIDGSNTGNLGVYYKNDYSQGYVKANVSDTFLLNRKLSSSEVSAMYNNMIGTTGYGNLLSEEEILPPTISDEGVNATTLYLYEKVKLNATITDNVGVSSAKFYYCSPSTCYNYSANQNTDNLDEWYLIVTTDEIGQWEFKSVYAVDVNDNVNSTNFSITFEVQPLPTTTTTTTTTEGIPTTTLATTTTTIREDLTHGIMRVIFDDLTLSEHVLCFYQRLNYTINETTNETSINYRKIFCANPEKSYTFDYDDVKIGEGVDYIIHVEHKKIDVLTTSEKFKKFLESNYAFIIFLVVILIIFLVIYKKTKK